MTVWVFLLGPHLAVLRIYSQLCAWCNGGVEELSLDLLPAELYFSSLNYLLDPTSFYFIREKVGFIGGGCDEKGDSSQDCNVCP